MAGQMTNGNFSLTSSTLDSRRHHGPRSAGFSSRSYHDDDEYFLATSSGMGYPSMTMSDSHFAVPVMSYDAADLTSEFLTEEAFSGNNSADMTFVPSHYPSNANSQDHMHPGYMPMESSIYMPGMVPTFNPADISRYPTPPPEEENDYFLQSVQGFQDQSCSMEKDFAMSHGTTLCLSSSDSLAHRFVRQPRPIRSASERSVALMEYCTSSPSPPEDRSPPKEDPPNREKARIHPYYNRGPDKNGKYHCPLAHEGNCNHQTTTQRCVYNKYVDSHLRPYRCKFTDRPECEDLRFSSNACLLRHEREAHGEHTHGMNPYLCKFPDCERAREGMGFPRRWNQRDHMKRVHQYEETDAPSKKSSSSQSQSKRRKATTTPTSVPMRRSSSSTMSKAHALVNASQPGPNYGPISRTQYGVPNAYSMPMQDYNVMMTQQVSMNDVQFSHQPVAISRTSRLSPPYSGVYPS
ncbi:hypothetical protein H2200_010142 [Cladophialophora chaetospira]|uniref:Uncharacterized protein n=1 Tax=Cladophialophora chaetospira TaxID=386627 RepID=A0AA38X2E8_9EURO|nr:hypothetical protein H2200_010142 [Cladophialophora chaetospira]